MNRPAERRYPRRWVWAAGAALAVAAVALVVLWQVRPTRVAVVHPRDRPVVESIAATGRVAGAPEALVAPDQPGRLDALVVGEGDRVARGDVVARLQSNVARADAEEAQAAIATAEAQLRDAQAGPRPSEVEQARAETRGTVADARGRLQRAEERLRELLAGGTSTDREQAVAQVRQAEEKAAQARREVARASALAESDATARAPLAQAQAALRDAEARVARAQVTAVERDRDLARAERLLKEGAIPRAQRDGAAETARTAHEDLRQAAAQRQQAAVEVSRQRELLGVTRRTELQRAQADLRVAQQAAKAARAQLQSVSQPARAEEIAQQRAEVAAASEALRQAQAGGDARLRTLVAGPRPERIAVAQRQLQQAVAARDAALARLRNAVVTAPFSGVVTEILNYPGAAVGPGQPILRLTEIQAPEVRVDVDERNVARVRPGQQALLVADAYPGQTLAGQVSRIGAQADPQGGTVEVVIRPLSPPAWLRSGLTVDANIIVAERQSRLVVPTTAILRRGDRTLVLVVERGAARERRIVPGEGGAEGTIVLDGLQPGDWVVVQSTAVKPGQRVRTQVVGR